MNKLFIKYSRDRKIQYQIKTEIRKHQDITEVAKSAIYPQGKKHLEGMFSNYQILKEKYTSMNVATCEKKEEELIFEYIKGETLDSLLIEQVSNKKVFFQLMEKYLRCVDELETIDFIATKEAEDIFGDSIYQINGIKACKIANIDLVFDNVIVHDDIMTIIDYEWVFNFPIPKEFIIYRAIVQFFFRNEGKLDNYINLDELFEYAKIDKTRLSIYDRMNDSFYRYVFIDKKVNYSSLKDKYIKTTLATRKRYTGDIYIQLYVDTGNGLSEVESIKFYIGNERKLLNIKFDISHFNNVRSIRLDPANINTIVRVTKVIVHTKDGKQIDLNPTLSNAIIIRENMYYFYENDPWIYFDYTEQAEKQDVSYIELEVMYEDFGLEEHIWQSVNELATIRDIQAKSINDKEQYIEQQNHQMEEQTQEIEERNKQIEVQTQEIEAKNKEIEVQIQKLEEKALYINEKQGQIEKQEEAIRQYVESIKKLEMQLAEEKAYIESLEDLLQNISKYDFYKVPFRWNHIKECINVTLRR